MANPILAYLPDSIEAIDDRELVTLCDEGEFLISCTPLERELIVRLGAALEVHQTIEDELQAEIDRLAQYEPARVAKARQKASKAALYALVAQAEQGPKARVRISD